jgi:hypothetical protein
MREALASKNLPWRLDLVGRSRYLDDLKLTRRFHEALERDLAKLLDESLAEQADVPALVEDAARKNGLNPELLQRAVVKLGLVEKFEARLPNANARS